MADIKPFRGVHYTRDVFPIPPVSPPYDIISEKQRQALASDEHNMINLDKPGNESDAGRYEKSAERFTRWKNTGVFTRDLLPGYYVYSQNFRHPETGEEFERTGFFGLVKLEPHYEKSIFPHEKTLSAPKADRLHLMRATRAHLSPVFGLYDDPANQAAALFAVVKATQPMFDTYTDFDGTTHHLWNVTDAGKVQQLSALLRNRNVIIADGHHRYETALRYAEEMREKTGVRDGQQPFDYVLMCLINFNDTGLIILPTHRLFTCPVDGAALTGTLATFFTITEMTPAAVEKALLQKKSGEKVLGFYYGQPQRACLLALKKDEKLLEGIIPPSASSAWRRLEVNVLYYIIIKHIMQMNDADFEANLTYSHSFSETFNMVDAHEAQCAFLLPPCNKEELEQITSAREVMPQKSTYFYPKIFSGFVLYDHG